MERGQTFRPGISGLMDLGPDPESRRFKWWWGWERGSTGAVGRWGFVWGEDRGM